MSIEIWAWIMVAASFSIYFGIAIWARVGSTKDFYVAGGSIPSWANGMATGADWMSAASFISMAGIISFNGYDGSVYLMGWTGGFVLLALLLAPYLRKFGKFTVPDFIGDRYYSNTARTIAIICALIVSFTYIAGQVRGVGIVISEFLQVSINFGIGIGMIIVMIFAFIGGMKGITYTQVAQYCVMIFAFMVPAIFLSIQMTGNPIPQLGMGGLLEGNKSVYLLDKLDALQKQLGFNEYTSGAKSTWDVFAITLALMVGTAGLPHVIVRFFTVPKVKDARKSAGLALLFIAILYTTAPAIAVFARTNLIETVSNKPYSEIPEWFKSWENNGLIAWSDKNGDGRIQYVKGNALKGKNPAYIEGERGKNGERMISNASDSKNELYVDQDIMVLANPEIAQLPDWVIGLVVAGGLAAALSTAAGLLLVISTSISHDLIKKQIKPNISEKGELLAARISTIVAVFIAGLFGIYPPGFVAAVVALAFGFAASSFFPAIVFGIFDKRMNKQGAISGMVTGTLFMLFYVIRYKTGLVGLIDPLPQSEWWFGTSPEGFGTIAMLINVVVSLTISRLTPAPPEKIKKMVETIRIPSGAGKATSTH